MPKKPKQHEKVKNTLSKRVFEGKEVKPVFFVNGAKRKGKLVGTVDGEFVLDSKGKTIPFNRFQLT